MTDVRLFSQIEKDHGDLVGGKGLQLALLTQAKLPVPEGFCVTAVAHRRLNGTPLQNDSDLVNDIVQAYHDLGGGPVAVRSSATSEDGSVTSFAGQQETVLGVKGASDVLDAIAHCWNSLHSERANAYRQQHQASSEGEAMAVVVQKLIPAEVAGVLFTRDPLDPEGRRMLIEASWGLGETVVSGQVMPDRFTIDRDTGELIDQQIHTKTIQRTADGPEPVPPKRQKQPCLTSEQLKELCQLAMKIEKHYGEPRDVEWGWTQEDNRFWVLQARPITTPDAAEREQARREEVAQLRELAEPEGTVWSRFNLSEILPEPTPMSWAIVRRLMSGKGGLGLMYRDLGFNPDRSLDEMGAYDLICGRTYCNLSREPRFYSGWIPYEHPFELLKAHPEKAIYPQALPNPSRRGPLFWLFLPIRLPIQLFRSIRFALRLNNYNQKFPEKFRHEIIPDMVADVEREQQEDVSTRTTPALLERLEHWIHRALYDFARDSLKPTALASIAMGNLRRLLMRPLGVEGSQAVLSELTMGIQADPEADLPGAVTELQAGTMTRETFLHRYGHRGPREMELASPRWNEMDKLPVASSLASQPTSSGRTTFTPRSVDRIAEEANLKGLHRTALEQQITAMQTHLSLRETAKHYLMLGYALIRRFLVELGKRFDLGEDVFFLTPDELPHLIAGKHLTDLIQKRKRRREIVLAMELPQVLFSDDLDAIGRPVIVEGATELQGVPLSLGSAEAPALVLSEPNMDNVPEEPYVLVCPSTDPAWVPLFSRAKALVMETGGTLSHGAIVAREFGLPAVAGLPGVLQQIQNGQIIRVDGTNGKVWLRAESDSVRDAM